MKHRNVSLIYPVFLTSNLCKEINSDCDVFLFLDVRQTTISGVVYVAITPLSGFECFLSIEIAISYIFISVRHTVLIVSLVQHTWHKMNKSMVY